MDENYLAMYDYACGVIEEKRDVDSDTAQELLDECLRVVNDFLDGKYHSYFSVANIVDDWCGTDNPTFASIILQLARYKEQM